MKNKLIYILIGICIFLLAVSVVYDIATEEEPVPVVYPTRDLIEKRFMNVLDDFNIALEWVNVRHINSDEYDSLEYVYYVKLPKGVTPVNILRDMNAAYIDDKISLTAEEKEINGRTSVNVYADDVVKLQAFLTPDTNLVREVSRFAFILTDIEQLSMQAIDTLRGISYSYGFAVVPSRKGVTLADSLLTANRELLVMLNDKLDDDYDLKGGMKRGKLDKQLKTISREFGSAKIYLFEYRTELFNSLAKNYIVDFLYGRGKQILRTSIFNDLRNNEQSDLLSLLRFYEQSGRGEKVQVFLITAKSFLGAQEFLEGYIKKGNKLLFPSSAL